MYQNGTALVTTQGLLHFGAFYSCRKAIAEQWFYEAYWNGEWCVGISFKSSDPSVLMLEDNDGELCRKLDITVFEGEKLEQYYDLMQIIKESRQKCYSRGYKSKRKKLIHPMFGKYNR